MEASYDERALLVNRKTEHYIPIFNSLEQGKTGGWNWCGFLIGPLWFVYRKMYIEGAIAYAGIYCMGIISTLLVNATGNTDLSAIVGPLSVAWQALQGGMANKVYWWRNRRLMDKLPNTERRAGFIKRNGGTSALAVVIALIIIGGIITTEVLIEI